MAGLTQPQEVPACVPFDPLTPDQPHDPADGSAGVVVGDDTGNLPVIRPRRRRHCWGLIITTSLIVSILVWLATAILAAPAAGTPNRSLPALDRCCGDRTPLVSIATLLPARTPTPDATPTTEETL